MATVALSGIITPTNVVTATSTTTLTNKTLTGAVMNGTLGATTPSTVVATTVKASTTMGVGGATPSASGAGITFPATASDSTSANTLDDYEEGTWTPVLDGAASPTYSSRTGTYTKIGNRVVLFFEIRLSAISGAGSTWVTGVPFTPSGDDGNVGSVMVSSGGVGFTAAFGALLASDPTVYLYTQGATARTNWTVSQLTSSSIFSGTIVYKTA